MSRDDLRFELATEADDAELRALLRRNPMEGDLQLTLEREPGFFLSAGLEGERHQVVVARQLSTGRLLGMGSRAVRPAWVNGEVTALGYLSQLRVDRELRGRKRPLVEGYRVLEEQHRAEGGPPLYVTTIVSDNRPARRLLEAGLRGFPTYVPVGELVTLAISVLGPRRLPPGAPPLRRGQESDLAAIAGLLERDHRRFQLAPRFTREDLLDPDRTRGLGPADFYLVGEPGAPPEACLARWDQLAFKQAVVRGYSRGLGMVRPLQNLLHRLLGTPRLPAVGATFRNLYLCLLAGEVEALPLPLLHAYNDAVAAGYELITLGLCRTHPALEAVKRLFPSHREYSSQVYVVHWEDGAAAARALDGRPPHLEVAVL